MTVTMGRHWWIFTSPALILIVICPLAVVSEEPPKMIDFVLLVEVTLPEIPFWTPSDRVLPQVKMSTDKLHDWIEMVVKSLLKEAQSKRIDARVMVYVVDATDMENPMKKEAEFYSRDYDEIKPYIMRGLRFAYTKRLIGRQFKTYELSLKINKTVLDSKIHNRTGVPSIFVWHVACDIEDSRIKEIQEWRKRHEIRDMMVALSDYWDSNIKTRVVIDHVLIQNEPIVFRWEHFLGKKDVHRPVIEAVWKIADTCRTVIKFSQCYFNAYQVCVKDKELVAQVNIPDRPNPSDSYKKYCMTGTKPVRCEDDARCERLCQENYPPWTPCSVSCGDEGVSIKMGNISNKYTRHCPRIYTPCNIPCGSVTLVSAPGRSPTSTVMITFDHDGIETSTTAPGIVLEPWMIAVIANVGLVVIIVTVVITLCCVRKRQRRRRTEQIHGYKPSPVPDHPSTRGLSRTRSLSRTREYNPSGHRYSNQPGRYPHRSRATEYSHRPTSSSGKPEPRPPVP